MSPTWKTICATAAVVILSVALLGISSAVAAPPDHCEKRTNHPRCNSGTTTTTSLVATTTSAPSTTTTLASTTTTPGPGGLTIPPTLPYPVRGSGVLYEGGGGYDIMAGNAATGATWWVAAYWGDNGLAYTDGATWLSGDREGYRCAYGFITGPDGDTIQGRFAFVRPPGQSYAKVNDKYMDEGERYLDGSPYSGGGREINEENCTDILSPIDYTGACRDVDERPRIAFFDIAGNVLDIRDYSNTKADNVVFNLHSFDGERATVIACEGGLVGMVVYYDALYGGHVAVDYNGTGAAESTLSATPSATSATFDSTAEHNTHTFE